MITKEKLLTMLQMQDALNQKIHPQWRAQQFKWTRAIMVEAVEALDHYGWKWWKQQTPDMTQVKLKMVDIWHFILSHEIEVRGIEAATDHLYTVIWLGTPAYLIEGDTRKTFDLMIASAAVCQVPFSEFKALMVQCGLTWDELYVIYISKNVLNTLRQDHGYKDGIYVKDWGGVEDNVAVAQLMALKPDVTPEQLRTKLESVYARVLAAAAV